MPQHPRHNFKRRILCSVMVGLSLVISSLAWGEDEASQKEIHVFIDQQSLIAFENGEEIYNFDIVTGRDGKETTAGTYNIFRKHEKYTSKTYGSEMPYTMFFTADGKAIHGTQMATLRSYLHAYLTEGVGSQGCVGLTDDNAKALFDWAPMGTPVVVINEENQQPE
jgi:lipoprotein-anchoring transpeptidase ErfK/SrfK